MVSGKGELYACEMDGQLVAYNLKTKARRVVADKYEGKRFNAPFTSRPPLMPIRR